MKLNKAALGIALGICWGASLVLATLWVRVVGGEEAFEVLTRFYPGYSVTIPGALIGMIYGFIDGFIYGFFLAWLYNSMVARFPSEGNG